MAKGSDTTGGKQRGVKPVTGSTSTVSLGMDQRVENRKGVNNTDTPAKGNHPKAGHHTSVRGK